MTNEEFYDLVMEVVMRSGDTLSRAFAVKQLRVVLQNLDNSPFHPWFLEKEGAITLPENLDYAELPTDFLDFLEDNDVYRYPGDDGTEKKVMNRGFFEDLQDVYANQDPGPPEGYDLVGTRFYYGPIADANYTARFWYMQKTAAPADDQNQVSNLWILHAEDYVAHLVGARVARMKLRNAELAKDLRDEALALRSDLFRMHEARKHSNMDYRINK